MTPALLLTDVTALQCDLEALAGFLGGQREMLLKIATLIGDDNKIDAGDVARAFEAAEVWSAGLAGRLDQAGQAIFSQLTLMQAGGD